MKKEFVLKISKWLEETNEGKSIFTRRKKDWREPKNGEHILRKFLSGYRETNEKPNGGTLIFKLIGWTSFEEASIKGTQLSLKKLSSLDSLEELTLKKLNSH